MSGDALAIFLALISFAGAGVLTAISTDGVRSRISVGVAAVSGLGALVFWRRPSNLDVVAAWNYIIAAMPLAVVSLVLIARKPASGSVRFSEGSVPDGSEADLPQPGGTPDTTLVQAFDFVQKGSYWSQTNKPKRPDTLREMEDKLYMRKLSAWGRPAPDARPERIPWSEWQTLKLNPGTSGAQKPDGLIKYHDVQFVFTQLLSTWAARTA